MIRQVVFHALRNVTRQRRRTGFVVGAIGFGVAALILAGGFIEWIFWATREGTIQTGLGHIQVVRPGFHAKGAAALERYLLPQHSPVLESLQRAQEVRVVAPRLSFSGLVSRGEATLSFLAEGVDPEREEKTRNVPIVVEGEDLSSAAPEGILLGKGLAANLGARVGDRVVLLAQTRGGAINGAEATVRGLFATISKAYDDSALRVPLEMARSLVLAQGAHRWVVVLHDTGRTASVLAALREQHAAAGVEFVPWDELADFYNQTVALLSRQMRFVELIIALIIVFTISNSMMTGVIERTGEIGTAMALGTRRRGILAQFLAEGLLLGVLGGAAGALIGVTLAALVSAIGIPMPPPPGQSEGFSAKMMVTAPLVASALAIAVLTAMGAALYPAWKAARMPIVDALRRNR
jgi:putative ABC transport system permease protein